MLVLLMLIFIALPIVEIAIFLDLAKYFGVWPMLGMVLLTAIAGSTLLQYQGFTTLQRVRNSVAQGNIPVRDAFSSLCLLLAGVLLISPGFLTDSFGLILFLPIVREFLANKFICVLSRKFSLATKSSFTDDWASNYGHYIFRDKNTVINGKFEEVRDNKDGHNNDINASWRI